MVRVAPIGPLSPPTCLLPQVPLYSQPSQLTGPTAMHTDPLTGELKEGILKVRYSHDAMIDVILTEPTIRQNDLAAMFDRSPSWVSQIMNSDAFQARLEERRAEIVDPTITATLKERLSAVADTSLQKLLEKISTPVQLVTDDFMLQTAKFATTALGYGARAPAGASETQVNVGVVVHVPPKIESAQSWVEMHAPTKNLPSHE